MISENDIIYEDNHIIVVNKKSGILSQSNGTDDADILTMIKNYLKVKYDKKGNVYLGLVHRLDRMVSGVMVFAKTLEMDNFIKNICVYVQVNLIKIAIQ